MESFPSVATEVMGRAAVESSKSVAMETLSHVVMETSSRVDMDIQSCIAMDTQSCVDMETLSLVGMETPNGFALEDAKGANTSKDFSSLIRNIPLSTSIKTPENSHHRSERKRQYLQFDKVTSDLKREPFSEKDKNALSDTEFDNEKLSPNQIAQTDHASMVRLPGMECFIKSFSADLFSSGIDKENGNFDPSQYHLNGWHMGFDDPQYALALWRPW